MPSLQSYLVGGGAVLRALGHPKTWWKKAAGLRWQRAYGCPAPATAEFLGNLQPGAVTADDAGLTLGCAGGVLRVDFPAEGVARVRLSRAGAFPPLHSYAVLDPDCHTAVETRTDGPIYAASPLLRVTASPAPCRLTFSDAGGRVLLADADGAGWEGEGVTCTLRLPAEGGLYGLGEKAFGLNQRGRRLVFWNSDPKGGYQSLSDPLYISIPFLLGQRDGVAWGVFFDNTYRAEIDLGHADRGRLVYRAAGGELCYYVLAGPTLADVLARYADLTGHVALPPRWALGFHQSRWGYRDAADLRRVAGELRARRIPCDALYLDLDFMDGCRVFTWDAGRFPDPAGLTADLRRDGFRVVTIVDPGVKADPADAVCADGLARDAFCRLPDGELYSGPVWPGECYFPDFSNPDVRAWWGEQYGRLLEAGVAGFWNDMNEPAVFPMTTFPDAVQHRADAGPSDHRALHNVYGLLMARACAEGLRRLRPDERPFVISRSGYAGVQRDALNWTGDNESSWAHLRLSIPMALNLGLSGQPFVGADVGGFNGACDGELLARWTQVGAFMPFFRNHNTLGAPSQEPYALGEEIEAICRRAIELRYRLLPYIYTAFWQAAERGLPVARPLALAFGADRRAASLDDQYMFGDALLVAPILAPGSAGRGVYLPAGGWYDFWSGARHDGPNDIPAHAPLDVLPLFARAGAVLPLGPVMQHSDAVVPERLDLHIFGGDGESWLYEDDGRSLAHRRGESRLTRFVVQAEEHRLTVTRHAAGPYDPGILAYDLLIRGWQADPPRPDQVRIEVDGRPHAGWTWDAEWRAPRIAAGMFEQIIIGWE